MKLTFDVLAATNFSGGMKLHATEVLDSWFERYPEDHLTIIGGPWVRDRYSTQPNARIITWNNENVLSRAVGQIVVSAVAGALSRSDVVVSLSPIVSPLVPRNRAICFQHDWRHHKNPEEFPALQHYYRKLWEVSAKHALVNVCISDKAQQETNEIVPGARTTVIENGGDHPRKWSLHSTDQARESVRGRPPRTIVTFGHHNNKRPELVMKAVQKLLEKSPVGRETRLVLLGARGEYQETLARLAVELNIGAVMESPGFVSDEEYQRIISSASVVVLASSDEGFGLPIAEADYFGIPAVVTSDSGISDIFPQVHVADPTTEDLAGVLSRVLESKVPPPARSLSTWSDLVRGLRSTIELRSLGRISHTR